MLELRCHQHQTPLTSSPLTTSFVVCHICPLLSSLIAWGIHPPAPSLTTLCTHCVMTSQPPALIESSTTRATTSRPPALSDLSAAHHPHDNYTTLTSALAALSMDHHPHAVSCLLDNIAATLLSLCRPRSAATQQQRCATWSRHVVRVPVSPPPTTCTAFLSASARGQVDCQVISTWCFGSRSALLINAVNCPGKMRRAWKWWTMTSSVRLQKGTGWFASRPSWEATVEEGILLPLNHGHDVR